MTDQASFEDRLRRQIEAYHEAALVYAAVQARPPRPARGGRSTTSRATCRKRSGCRPPHLTASCAGFAASAFARSCLTARSRSTPAGQSLRSGSPSRLAEKVQIVVGQYWWPWANVVASLKTGKPGLRAGLRHERLRLARARTPSKARCSTPIWPRRRWRRRGPSSLRSIIGHEEARRYWRRLWRDCSPPC